MERIAVIGAGNIGEALISGLVASGVDPADRAVRRPHPVDDRVAQRRGLGEGDRVDVGERVAEPAHRVLGEPGVDGDAGPHRPVRHLEQDRRTGAGEDHGLAGEGGRGGRGGVAVGAHGPSLAPGRAEGQGAEMNGAVHLLFILLFACRSWHLDPKTA